MSLLMVGCTTVAPKDDKTTVYNMEDSTYRLSFLISMNTCFIGYNTCTIKKFTKSKCWKDHERCVISTNKQYKHITQQAEWRRNK